MRILSLVMISVFTMGIVGYFPIFKLEQYRIRKEIKTQIKNKIPISELHTFRFKNPTSDVIWIRPQIEFRLNGHMYDVVHEKKHKTFTEFKCVNDTEETILFANLDQAVQDAFAENSRQNKKKGSSHENVPFQLFFNSLNVHFPSFYSVEKEFKFSYFFALKTNVIELITPPPKLILAFQSKLIRSKTDIQI